MKKIIIFLSIILIIVAGILYSTYGRELISNLDEKRVYSMADAKTTSLNLLDEFKFYNGGIVTYNSQKLQFINYDSSVAWERENNYFANRVFVTDNYIFSQTDSKVEVLDKNNQKYVIAEISGDILNVSRENGEVFIVVRLGTGQNSLYVMNDNNEIVVDNKIFDDIITGVAISDKSEAYALTTLSFEKGVPGNMLYFNLLDDVELWSVPIENEILIKTQIVNNNVIAVGSKNIYYFNTNGKLMWKNSIYNKISDIEIDKESQKIYILYDKDVNTELISYSYEGKVVEIQEAPAGMDNLKLYGSKVFVAGGNGIFLLHGSKADKIYEDSEDLIDDFELEGNLIRIISKDKLVTGRIK